MGLFRTVLKSGELSERVLELTEDLLAENAANYTVWQYRRECLRALQSDLHKELDFMDTFAEENPKNYQIWHHRRSVVEMLGNGDRELAFTADVFAVDSKNYHAWAHRQWAVSTFQLWEGELEYMERLLTEDIRNNSAWNQRWFVIHRGGGPADTPLAAEVMQQELTFAFGAVDKVTKNESAWNYIRGLAKFHPECIPEVLRKCQDFDVTAVAGGTAGSAAAGASAGASATAASSSSRSGDADKDATKPGGRRSSKRGNPYAMALLADLQEAQGSVEALMHAETLCMHLQGVDEIRVKYWSRRVEAVRLKLAAL